MRRSGTPIFAKFPVLFPVSRENNTETGPIRTASATKYLHEMNEVSVAVTRRTLFAGSADKEK
jgi:hypothetical protein